MIFIPEPLQAEASLHIQNIQANFPEGCDALLIASNANIFYAALRFFRGYVYVPSKGKPIYFIIRPLGFEKSEGSDTSTAEPIVEYVRKPEEILPWLTKNGYGQPSSLGLELDSLTYSDVSRLSKAFGNISVVNASPILKKARMLKTDWEIAEMRTDGMRQAEAYRRFTSVYQEDMTDIEWQVELERILRLEGCLGYSRVSGQLMEINLGSVICGDNADAPTPYDFAMGGAGASPAFPVGADGSIMRPGSTVMVDMNGAFNGYQTDMTRVWRIGEIAGLAIKAHDCSLRILRTLEKIGIPGTPVADLYNRAAAIAEEEGLSEYFMGHRQKAPFIGHGVGIELNELPVLTPRSRDTLAAGMTIAIEPKFVIPQTGAVGAENTYVVTDSGLENITIFPEDIILL